MSDFPAEPPRSSLPPPSSIPPPPPDLSAPPPYPVGPAATQRVGGLGRALAVVLSIFVPLAAIALIVQLVLFSKAQDVLDGTLAASEFDDSYDSLIGLTLLPSAATVGAAVLTIIWMYRLASNLRALGRADTTWAPGWAIGGWFLPPCGVYAIPWLMLRELWKGSDPEVPIGDPTWKQRPATPLLTLWWVLFGLVPLVTLAGSWSTFTDLDQDDAREIAEDLDDRIWLVVLDSLVRIAAAVIFVVVVRRLTARHRRLTAEA